MRNRVENNKFSDDEIFAFDFDLTLSKSHTCCGKYWGKLPENMTARDNIKPYVAEAFRALLQQGKKVIILTKNWNHELIREHLLASGLSESEVAQVTILSAPINRGYRYRPKYCALHTYLQKDVGLFPPPTKKDGKLMYSERGIESLGYISGPCFKGKDKPREIHCYDDDPSDGLYQDEGDGLVRKGGSFKFTKVDPADSEFLKKIAEKFSNECQQQHIVDPKEIKYEDQDSVYYHFTETKEFGELLNVNKDRLQQERKEHWRTFSELLTAYIEQLNGEQKSSRTSDNCQLLSVQFINMRRLICEHLSTLISIDPLGLLKTSEPPENFTKKQIVKLIKAMKEFKKEVKIGEKNLSITLSTEPFEFNFFNKNERARLFSQLIENLQNLSAALDSPDTYNLPNDKGRNEENNQDNELGIKLSIH